MSTPSKSLFQSGDILYTISHIPKVRSGNSNKQSKLILNVRGS